MVAGSSPARPTAFIVGLNRPVEGRGQAARIESVRGSDMAVADSRSVGGESFEHGAADR
ncbi:hypothetical protein Pd630_LPD13025 (plasmid) [Rhodococcus opacus PD630]|nr:hypothetical protein Pd630_LPD13025 [Rhodococcus opacus PD630]